MEKKVIIKNIMWDVDGVLASLDHAYFRLLTEHPNYRDKYKGLKFEDLPVALPISPKFGTLELTTHPTIGKELNHDFCHNSGGIYFDRPLYPGVKEILTEFNKEGYFQLTMSSGFDAETKRKMISDTLGKDLSFVKIEVVEHAKTTEGESKAMLGEKEQRILECLEKYNLKPEETVLVDDRIFNCQTALKVGMKSIRAMWATTVPAPAELGLIELRSLSDFRDWLKTNTTQS